MRFLVLQNKSTKRIFWTPLYETNPQNKSFEHRTTKRIHETNLLNTVGIYESGPQDLYGFVVCLCSKDSWGFVGFVKKGRILSKTVYETNPRYGYLKTLVTNRNKTNPKIRICFVGTKRIFLSQDSWATIRYESTDSRNESMFLRISYTNPASLVLSYIWKYSIPNNFYQMVSYSDSTVSKNIIYYMVLFMWPLIYIKKLSH